MHKTYRFFLLKPDLDIWSFESVARTATKCIGEHVLLYHSRRRDNILQGGRRVVGVTLSLQMLAIVVSGILVAFRYDLFPVMFGSLPLHVRQSDDYLRGLAWTNRYQDRTVVRHGRKRNTEQRERSMLIEPFKVSNCQHKYVYVNWNIYD